MHISTAEIITSARSTTHTTAKLPICIKDIVTLESMVKSMLILSILVSISTFANIRLLCHRSFFLKDKTKNKNTDQSITSVSLFLL